MREVLPWREGFLPSQGVGGAGGGSCCTEVPGSADGYLFTPGGSLPGLGPAGREGGYWGRGSGLGGGASRVRRTLLAGLGVRRLGSYLSGAGCSVRGRGWAVAVSWMSRSRWQAPGRVLRSAVEPCLGRVVLSSWSGMDVEALWGPVPIGCSRGGPRLKGGCGRRPPRDTPQKTTAGRFRRVRSSSRSRAGGATGIGRYLCGDLLLFAMDPGHYSYV